MKENRKALTPLIALPIMLILAAAARGLGYLFVILSSDVVYMGTPLPDAVYVLSELFDVAMMFIGYGLIIRGVSSGAKRDAVGKSVLSVAVPFLVSALAHAASYFFSFLVYSHEYIGIDRGALAVSLLLNLAFELLRLIIVTAAAILVFFLWRSSGPLRENGLSPFSSPARLSLFCASVILLLSRSGVELFGTTLPFFAEYSDVSASELLSVVFTYLSIIFHAVIGYFSGIAVLFLSKKR